MIEVEEEVYEKLLKDANDNRSIIKMVKIGIMFIFLMIILIMYGTRLIDISLMNYKNTVECQIAVVKAQNNVRVREIESAGMSTAEYLKWLEVTSVEKVE